MVTLKAAARTFPAARCHRRDTHATFGSSPQLALGNRRTVQTSLQLAPGPRTSSVVGCFQWRIYSRGQVLSCAPCAALSVTSPAADGVVRRASANLIHYHYAHTSIQGGRGSLRRLTHSKRSQETKNTALSWRRKNALRSHHGQSAFHEGIHQSSRTFPEDFFLLTFIA